MPLDIEIARAARLRPNDEIAGRLGVPGSAIAPCGRHVSKIERDVGAERHGSPLGSLVLVTAITRAPAGDGKATTIVGLAAGLDRLRHRAAACRREPSLGPCFGMKGRAAGGGYAQVVPTAPAYLRFTGDIHAINAANNQLAACRRRERPAAGVALIAA